MNDIAFATDLADDEAPALATAVALAAAGGARLVSVHATTGAEVPASALARAEVLARRWGKPIEHQPLCHTCCDDVTDTLLDALRRVKPSLVVAGTHGRSGLAQLLAESVAEGVARNVAVPTLIVPLTGHGLADPGTGAIDLRTLVIPAGDAEATGAALRAAAWLAELAGARDAEAIVVHVADDTPPPALEGIPAGLRVTRRTTEGPLERSIAETAREVHACAIVMATRGHDSLADALGGSHTERVVRRVDCPVLSVPLPG